MTTTNLSAAEYYEIAIRLEQAIFMLRNKRKEMKGLAEKIQASNRIKSLEDQLYRHHLKRPKTVPFAQVVFLGALARIGQINFQAIPEQGVTLWSCRIGSARRYCYDLEIRACPDQQYRVLWRHSSGHGNSSSGPFSFLEGAISEALRQRRCYYDAEADDRAEALAAFHDAA